MTSSVEIPMSPCIWAISEWRIVHFNMYHTSQFNGSVYGKESLHQVEICICSVSLLWSQWWFPLWPFLGSSISNGEMWVEGKLIEGVLRVLITSYTFRCLVQLMMGHLWTDVWWNCMIWKLIFWMFQFCFNCVSICFNDRSIEALKQHFSLLFLLFAWIPLEMPKTEKSACEWKSTSKSSRKESSSVMKNDPERTACGPRMWPR